MPTPRPWEERLTTIDLFLEKRKIPIVWRIYAVVATWLLTAGCLLYPFSLLDGQKVKDHIGSSTTQQLSYPLLIVSICLLLISHVLEAFVAMRQNAILFWLEDLFLPFITATILAGIVAPILHLSFRAFESATPLLGVFILAGVSLLFHIPVSIMINRQISQIETADLQRRQRVAASPSSPWPTRYNSQRSGSTFTLVSRSFSFKRSHSRKGTSPSRFSAATNDDAHLLPEDEAQRQQLMKLLMKRDEIRPPVVTGPQGGGVQSTYRLDLPTEDDSGRPQRTRHLSVPTTYSNNRIFPTNMPGTRSDSESRQSPAPSGHLDYSVPSVQQEFIPSINVTEHVPRTFPPQQELTTYDNIQSHPPSSHEQSFQTNQPATPLHPSRSTVERERRRREIEQGEFHVLPAYTGDGTREDQRDQKGV